MPTKEDYLNIRKATIYDLLQLVEKDPNKTFTVEEIKAIFNAYIAGAQQ